MHELWHRDLFGIELLGAELRRRGYSVEVRNTRFPNAADRAIHPGDLRAEVVVLPWIYSNAGLKRALFMSGFAPRIVNLHSEQIHTAYTREARWTTIREEAVDAHHVAWGRHSEQAFVDWGAPTASIWSTGSIHLDLAHRRFDACVLKKADLAEMHGVDAGKHRLCLISSFPARQATPGQVLLDAAFAESLREKIDNALQAPAAAWLEAIDHLREASRAIHRRPLAEAGLA